jgi:beta-galactosidase
VADFDADWLFSRGDFASAPLPAFNDSSWRKVNLPHDWSIEGPFSAEYGSGNGYAPGGLGWYRKHFRLEPGHKGKSVAIELDGIYAYAEVWINGHFVGGRPYGYASFECRLTPHLRFGGEDNVLAVRVDHTRFADSRWYTGSGMYRHTRLRITDPLCIPLWGTHVTTPEIGKDSAVVRIETTVQNGSSRSRQFTLRSEIVAADGGVVADLSTAGTADAGREGALIQEMRVANPRLWSTDSPALYAVRSRLIADSRPVDETSTPFGIRSFQVDPAKGCSLNGRAIKLKGVCIHHDAGCLGTAVPDKVWERRLRLLKELGVNAIRTSHNPPAPELLDLCDRIGLLVKDEAFDEFTPPKNKWVSGWNAGVPSRFGYGEIFAEWAVIDIRDMVRRDRNHPSVILWSIGNEIDYPNDPFSHPVLEKGYRPENPPAQNLVKHARPLIDAVKALDNTRPVTAGLASLAMSDAVGLAEMLDAVGYNYQESRYAQDHQRYPRRIIFGSENNHQFGNWAVVRDNGYVAGQFLWTGIDYLGEAGTFPNRANGAGLLDLCGFKKPAAWFRQSLWSESPMVYLCTAPASGGARARAPRGEEHWNWPASAPVTVSCYTNCPQVQLILNGRTIGDRRLADAAEGVLAWEIPYEPGVLKAVGLRNGKPASEFSLITAGAPHRIELLPDVTELRADGRDICHIEFRIVDTQGVRVPDAELPVTFGVEGPAEILGIGSGDLNSIEDCQDRVHKAYQGRGLAILRTRTTAGRISVKGTAPGVAGAELTLVAR